MFSCLCQPCCCDCPCQCHAPWPSLTAHTHDELRSIVTIELQADPAIREFSRAVGKAVASRIDKAILEGLQ